jgi:alanyl-tRNA synthetase
MKHLSSNEVRAEFLSYFEKRQHRVCRSYPLVPPNDPSLLFTNAGMVQFKDVFTGREKSDFSRAVSSQKCVRAGGKHNDLENVGRTARHHTFFEMLGNFSFGDYFKEQAIRFAWEFLVDHLQLPAERLWITVFGGDQRENLPADDEAAELWRSEAGLGSDRILCCGKKDNFWSMGDTGPCGPCSEIHFDQGESVACGEPGGCRGVNCECDRFLEVWNLVFMQFDRGRNGKLAHLPAPSIDTGMGLERLCAIVQGVNTNYETDLFLPLLQRMGDIAGRRYGADKEGDVSLRVIADHARACAFLMADGVLPSNEGRGYVLRRIMRRAIRHGDKLGVGDIFFSEICSEVVRQMSKSYPELPEREELIVKAARLEEETFRRTLSGGRKILNKEIGSLEKQGSSILPGKLVFDLQTRDGFPPDLTAVIAAEHGMTLDDEAYRQAFAHHQQVSAGELGIAATDEIFKSILGQVGPSEFIGYDEMQGTGNVLALVSLVEGHDDNGQAIATIRKRVEQAAAGDEFEMLVSQTPFYGETGGQLGDKGKIVAPQGRGSVLDAQRSLPELIVHRVKLDQGKIHVGDEVRLEVDQERRDAIRRNHSATHLLQSALRQVLGEHVNQSGSLVAPDRFRFDFSHFAPMTREELDQVEHLVNRMIRANYAVEVTLTDIEGARKAGATMLFGEKYAQRVRMVRMGPKSLELCGGTHTGRSGDIGAFLIISEGSIKAGVRRIEALTGAEAINRLQMLRSLTGAACEMLKTEPRLLVERIKTLKKSEAEAEREIEKLKQKVAAVGTTDPASEAREIAGVRALAVMAKGIGLSGLREFTDNLKDRLDGVVMAFSEENGKLSAVCSVPKRLCEKLKAGDLLKAVFEVTGGKGGGRPDFAQGGGGDPAKFEQGCVTFYSLVEKTLTA